VGVGICSNLCVKYALPLQIRTAPQCSGCKARAVECRLCNGESTSDWTPLHDPVVARVCAFPQRYGNRYSVSSP
jgi:hypothetical protein